MDSILPHRESPAPGRRSVRLTFDADRVPRADRTSDAFVEELPKLLRERGLSIRAVGEAAGVTGAHLSRVLRQVDYKTVSPDLARRVAVALGLPADYFPEYRAGYVFERIKSDASLRDRLYDRLRRTTHSS